MSLTPEPIVILGAFRSGTSALATALDSLGVFLGDAEDFQPADSFNEGGYWEIQDQQVLNSRILAAFGMNYYQVDRLPKDWLNLPGSAAMVSEVAGLIASKFAGHPRWGWKEPATSVLMPVYAAALEKLGVSHPIYAICVRHPLSVASSQATRQRDWALDEGGGDHLPVVERTVGLWTHYTLASLQETRGCARVLIGYEDFLANPERCLEAIAGLVEQWGPTGEQMSRAVATVQPGWSHSRYSVEDLDGWPEIVGDTYRLCLEMGADPKGFQSGDYDERIAFLWDQWVMQSKMIRPALLPAGQLVLSWRNSQGQGQHAQHYTPTGTWQVVRSVCPAPPGSTLQIDPYQTPCQIWIRRAVWLVDGQEKRAVLNSGPYGMVQDLLGMKRVTVFGPAPIMSQAPSGAENPVLELEMLVRSGQSILLEVIGVIRSRIEQSRAQAPSPFSMRRG